MAEFLIENIDFGSLWHGQGVTVGYGTLCFSVFLTIQTTRKRTIDLKNFGWFLENKMGVARHAIRSVGSEPIAQWAGPP